MRETESRGRLFDRSRVFLRLQHHANFPPIIAGKRDVKPKFLQSSATALALHCSI